MLVIALICAAAMTVPAQAQLVCPDGETSPVADVPLLKLDPQIQRLIKYSVIEHRHRLTGLASYYSNSLDGTLTANGERYHKKKYSAAHLTLPLGSWVEITSKATGRKIRLRVND